MAKLRSEDIFLFVNPKSGGNKGVDFLKVPQPFVTDLESGRSATLHIYSLPDDPDTGFRKVKEIAEATGQPVRCVVGGGDGTVMWADCVATRNGIDTPRQIIYGIIPLGTGNDFSRVAGWGGKNPKGILRNDCRLLRDMVMWWSRATVRPHDVWRVTVEVEEEGGKIMKVKDKGEEEIPEKRLSAPMINYFSVGQESKVGVEFDKHRTKSQTCNLLVYAWEGMGAELDCGSKQKIDDIVSGLYHGTNAEGDVIFSCHGEGDDAELVGSPESLMFLNVNSYAGGAGQFWQLDAPVGLDPSPGEEEVNVRASPGDGRIEVVTLPNIANIALDKISHEAQRIHSGGPYHIEYFGNEDGEEQHAYCEVDGEFYHLVNPSNTTIAYLKKLQVLQNNVPEEAWMRLVRRGIELPANVAKTAMSAGTNLISTTTEVTRGVVNTITANVTANVHTVRESVSSFQDKFRR